MGVFKSPHGLGQALFPCPPAQDPRPHPSLFNQRLTSEAPRKVAFDPDAQDALSTVNTALGPRRGKPLPPGAARRASPRAS